MKSLPVGLLLVVYYLLMIGLLVFWAALALAFLVPLFGFPCALCGKVGAVLSPWLIFVWWAFLLYLAVLALLLLALLLLWLLARMGVACIFCKGGKGKGKGQAGAAGGSISLPNDVVVRADPLIYDQYFLEAQGIAVSWDNPDIWLQTVDPQNPDQPSGVTVSSMDLVEDTEYFIIAQIWNGSVAAPAIDLPVHFSFLTFGVGTTSTPIGLTHVDLGAKGLPGCPAVAQMKWRTPATPGHYCIQVKLDWANDAEPGNNLGQENTQVKALNSPKALFTVAIRNEARVFRKVTLSLDSYSLSARPACKPARRPPSRPQLSRAEIDEQKRRARAEHDVVNFPVPRGWVIELSEREFALRPGEQRDVVVDITAVDGFSGKQAINLHARANGRLLGGVTLYVTG